VSGEQPGQLHGNKARPGWLARLSAWRPKWGRGEDDVARKVCNLLVVSDMHLGEASKERSRIEYLKATGIEDREFCRFLEHHRTHRLDGQPWQLVFAGDVFDFPAVSLFPNTRLAQERGFSISDEERRRGLENSEEKIRWKLDRILDRHPAWLTHLADFVGSGNRVVFIPGNHDAELHWPGVQQELVRRLVDVYFSDEQVDGISHEDFCARIEFRDWVFFVPDLVYIEHGHQFDSYCSLLHPLYPRRPGQEELMELSSTGILIRYGLSQVTGVRSHGKDAYTSVDYLRWLLSMPAVKSGQLSLAYFQALREQFRYLHRTRRYDLGRLRDAHLLALVREAERQRLAPSTLAAIDLMRARPANLSGGSIVSSMFLDSILTFLLTPLLLLLWLLFAPCRWRGKLAGSTAILGGAFVLLQLFGARRTTALAPKLREAARLIAPLVHTPYVVMGHSHLGELLPLPGGALYANSGCWLWAGSSDTTGDAQGSAPLGYLVLRPQGEVGGPEASLMRWDPREGKPVLMSTDRRSSPTAPAASLLAK